MNKYIKEPLETNPIICTFFGHRDAGNEIYDDLRETIFDIIENKKVPSFILETMVTLIVCVNKQF